MAKKQRQPLPYLDFHILFDGGCESVWSVYIK